MESKSFSDWIHHQLGNKPPTHDKPRGGPFMSNPQNSSNCSRLTVLPRQVSRMLMLCHSPGLGGSPKPLVHGAFFGRLSSQCRLLCIVHTRCRDSLVLEVPKLSCLMTVSTYLNRVSLSFFLEDSCVTVNLSWHFQVERILKSSICRAMMFKQIICVLTVYNSLGEKRLSFISQSPVSYEWDICPFW